MSIAEGIEEMFSRDGVHEPSHCEVCRRPRVVKRFYRMEKAPKVFVLSFPRIEFVRGRRVKNPMPITPGTNNSLSLNVHGTLATYVLKGTVEHIGSIDLG